MPKDTKKLRQRLTVAIACFPLTLAPMLGCKDGSKAQEQAKPAAEASGLQEAADVSSESPKAEPEAPDASAAAEPTPPPTAAPGADAAMAQAPAADTSEAPEAAADTAEAPETPEKTTKPKRKSVFKVEGRSKGRAQTARGTWRMTRKEAQNLAKDAREKTAGCPDGFYVQPDGLEGVRWKLWLMIDVEETKRLQKEADDLCFYRWKEQLPPNVGRLLVDGDALCVAEVLSEPHQELAPELTAMPEALRSYLAQAWLRDALMEHASVASFARATLELMRLGAPAPLVAAAQQGGLDEVRHAQACFALASTYGGRPVSPGAMPLIPIRDLSLEELAVTTLLEGGVGETIAILCATRALDGCQVPAVTAALTEILEDETEHAALAWATVAWALHEGGEPVRAALETAAREAYAEQGAKVSPPPYSKTVRDALAVHGRLDEAALYQAANDAWRGIILPQLEDLGIEIG